MWRGVVKSTLENNKMGSFQGFQMIPCTKSQLLEGPLTFMAPNGPSHRSKSLAPLKVSSLCQDHLESLKWPHLIIFEGWIHNPKPHLKQGTGTLIVIRILKIFHWTIVIVWMISKNIDKIQIWICKQNADQDLDPRKRCESKGLWIWIHDSGSNVNMTFFPAEYEANLLKICM